ncbi:MAG: hypothetical protein C4K58_06900 [Flavobacteriaceae bacterium]|nr:MAG: hypothetical protein C4K58_06900 [Flavobacteriaceae bacterium]
MLSSGIDVSQFEKNPLMYYLHSTELYGSGIGEEVIGRWENLRLEGDSWYADAVFDRTSELGAKIAKKVEGGFLRMTSMGIGVTEISEDPLVLLSGQTRPTVSKCRLFEISICPEGLNDGALLKLSYDGKNTEVDSVLPLLSLSKNPKNNPNPIQKNMKNIAISLKLAADASEGEILTAINALHQEVSTAKKDLTTTQKTLSAVRDAQVDAILQEAVDKGVLSEELKPLQLSAFKSDFDGTLTLMKSLISKKEQETLSAKGAEKPKSTKEAVEALTALLSAGAKGANEGKTFDDLQKNNPEELRRLKAEEPEEYDRLVKEYTNQKNKN